MATSTIIKKIKIECKNEEQKRLIEQFLEDYAFEPECFEFLIGEMDSFLYGSKIKQFVRKKTPLEKIKDKNL